MDIKHSILMVLLSCSLHADNAINKNSCFYGKNQEISNKSHEILLIDLVNDSMEKAALQESKLINAQFRFRVSVTDHLLNNICAMPGMSYAQSGLFDGYHFISAVFDNSALANKAAVKILETERIIVGFSRRCSAYLHTIYQPICLQTHRLPQSAFNVYFCNQPSRLSVLPKEVLESIDYALSPIFILVINEWELLSVRESFCNAFESLEYKFMYETCMQASESETIYIAVIRKPSDEGVAATLPIYQDDLYSQNN